VINGVADVEDGYCDGKPDEHFNYGVHIFLGDEKYQRTRNLLTFCMNQN
jgi:hypothetical protein